MTTHLKKTKRHARCHRVGSLLEAASDWLARTFAPQARNTDSLDLLLLEDRVFFNAASIGDVLPDAIEAPSEQVDGVISLIDLAVWAGTEDFDASPTIDQAIDVSAPDTSADSDSPEDAPLSHDDLPSLSATPTDLTPAHESNVAITVTSVGDLAAVPEFLVNTGQTVSSQATSNEDRGSSRAIATASDGSYVVVWTDNVGVDSGVNGQRYDRFGEPLGVNFAVNQTTVGNQRWASVDTDNNGNFVATWVSENQDGTPRSVYARRFAADGTALGSEFRVNTTNSGTQDNSSVAVDANGNFVIVWEGAGAGGYDIYGRRFDAAGMALGNEFQISATAPDGEPAVAIADDGRFVVVWDDNVGIRARLYAADGNPVTGEFVVHTETFAGESAVAMDANGNFVTVWRETNGGKDVYFRQFDSLGNPLDITRQLNTTTANTQTNPSIAADAAGNFVVTWEGRGPGDTDGVFYRRFTAAGVALDAAEVLVNQTTTGTQNQASLAVQNVNNFAVAWTGNGPGDADGVFVRQFGTANRPPINSVPSAQSINEDALLSFEAANGNQLSITDPDAASNLVQVTLSVTNGTVTLPSTTGLVFGIGDGIADPVQRFTGTVANINTALAQVRYAPNEDFNGNAQLQILTDDLGNTGTGGPQVDVDTVAITVRSVNDAPIAYDNGYTVNEDAGQITGNVISNDTGAGVDFDVEGNTLYVLEVNGDPNLAGVPINLASGATLRIDRDGALQYDLKGQFHSLTASQIANESFTYTIADGWNVRMIQVTGSGIDSTVEAEGILAAATGFGSLSANGENYNVTFFGDTVASEIDYGSGNHNPGINDGFDVNNVFPNGVADGGNDFLVSATSSWTVPAGTYTLALGSDDGGYIRLSGGLTFSSVFNSTIPAGSNEIRFNAPRAHSTTGGTFTVAQPTQITLDALAWDHLSHSSFEISIASGTHASFNGAVGNGGSFQLLQEGSLGWSLTHAHASVSITVQGTNDAPVLNTAAGFTLPAIADDELNSPGKTVAGILASVSGTPITDADTPVGQIGIAITGRPTSFGDWQYSLNNGANWTSLPSVSDDSALTLDPTAKLRFVPDFGRNGTASFSWRAWDQTTAANGQTGVDTTPAGGQTAFSTASALAGIAVADKPQPPQLAPETYNVLANGSLTISAPGLLANDYDPDAPSPPLPVAGAKLVYNAANDVNGNSSWEDATNVSGFNWAFSTGVSRVVNPASLRPGIQEAYNFANAGATTDPFATLPGDPSDAPASFEVWFRPVNDSDRDVIFETGGATDGLSISLAGQTLSFVVRDTEATVAETQLTAIIDPFEYSQVVGVIDTNTGDVRLYVNGVLADSATNIDLRDWSGSDGAGLGRGNGSTNLSSGTNFEGEISLFRFYESALTATQVLNNYDSVATGLKVINASSPLGGHATVLPGGKFVFTPNGDFDPLRATETADVSFTYTVQDGSGLTATATAGITVRGVDDPPVTAVDNYSVNSGETLTISKISSGVLGNDRDPEGNTPQAGTLTATATTAPTKGTLTLSANGEFVYVANGGAVGTDEFFYVANDGNADSQPTRVVITIVAAGAPGGGSTGGGSTGGGESGSTGGTGDESGGSAESISSPASAPSPPAPVGLPTSSGATASGGQQQVDSLPTPSEELPRSASTQEAEQLAVALQPVFDSSTLGSSDTRDRLRALAQEVVDAAVLGNPLASGVMQLLATSDFAFIAESSPLWQDLQDLEDLVEHDIRFEAAEVASALSVTTTLSVGYVLWFLRGTYLVSCVLAQMPAWKMVDPLFVFGGGELLGDEDDESLNAMLQRSNDADHEAEVQEGATLSTDATQGTGEEL